MLAELGVNLRRVRAERGRSLESVAGEAGISATYLHKLERGNVASPSPRVLARVATALDVDYLRLMELAGYLDELQLAECQARSRPPTPHPLAHQQLSSEEWQLVGSYIRHLLALRTKKPREVPSP